MQTNTTHTKGPWKGEINGDIRTEDGDLIAQVFDNPGEEEAIKNISLIVAAPELLDACKFAFEIMRHQKPPTIGGWNWPFIAEQLKKAIDKAEFQL